MILPMGSVIELPDKRVGTVVYNSLVGQGIRFGKHTFDPAIFDSTNGDTLEQPYRADLEEWVPEAVLRNWWEGANIGFTKEQFVGEEFKVLRWGLTE